MSNDKAIDDGNSGTVIAGGEAVGTWVVWEVTEGAIVAFKKLNGKHLLVVYSTEKSEIRIITTFITSSAQEIISTKLSNNVWLEIK
jgi:hypothetical protein